MTPHGFAAALMPQLKWLRRAGAAILFKIPRVVIGENRTFMGAEEWMRANGAELIVVDDPRCIALMERMKREKPDLWAEDIGE